MYVAEANEEIVKVTFGELRRDVALFAAAMRKMGIKTGDRVVGECHLLFLFQCVSVFVLCFLSHPFDTQMTVVG